MIILCFVVTDSLQGFILFWIFTFNKRVFDLYSKLGQRLRVWSVARQEERDRLRLRAAMMRQQSQTLSVADLELQSRKLSNMLAWLVRARKESGASQSSTSTQDTTVKSNTQDRLAVLDQVLERERLRSQNCYLYPSDPSGTK